MRIRSIKPEFYASEDVGALSDWADRLLFIGLWSYVDDNGVGRDSCALIAADLFPYDMERDAPDTLARVTRGLATLSDADLITRYKGADGRSLLFVTGWAHQRIDKPAKPRYPLPTRGDANSPDFVATPSRDIHEEVAPGTEEQGNREQRRKNTSSTADAVDAEFTQFWQRYPRKVGKGQAIKAYRTARKKVPMEAIAAALRTYVAATAHLGQDRIRHASTWLNGEPWHDDPAAIAPVTRMPDRRQQHTDDIFDAALNRARNPEPERRAL